MPRWFALWGVMSLALVAPEVVSPAEAVANTRAIKKTAKKCKGKKCRRGRYFYGCTNYKADKTGCDYVSWYKPLNEPCPQCS